MFQVLTVWCSEQEAPGVRKKLLELFPGIEVVHATDSDAQKRYEKERNEVFALVVSSLSVETYRSVHALVTRQAFSAQLTGATGSFGVIRR